MTSHRQIFRSSAIISGASATNIVIGILKVKVLAVLLGPASPQIALLQGLRRIGDLARVNIISAFFGATVGILLVYFLGEEGVLWFVLTAPAVSMLVAGYYAARLPRPQTPHDWQSIGQEWGAMLKLGIPLMTAGLLTLVTQLVARSIILRQLGLDATGHFQAAWAISMTYIGFVLSAMSTDYYPRLTAAINDHPQARKMVDEQAEMALLLAAPVLLAMITLAPWVIHILYAASFAPATDVLRWQVLGDIVKVSSWPMGFILLAQGRGGIFIGTELTWNVAYLSAIILGIHEWGLVMAGAGFCFAYLIYYGVVAIFAFRLIGFKSARRNWIFTLLLLLAGGLIMFLAARSASAGYAVGAIATLAVGVYSLRRLDGLVDLRGWLRKRFEK